MNYGTCTLPEGRMITKAILEGSIKGTGKFHKTSVFPCGIYVCKSGVNRHPGDPNYDLFRLALKSTSLRLYPNYSNDDCANQVSWVKYDRDAKREVINNLSEEDYKLFVEKLFNNKELQNFFMVNISDDNKIIVRDEEEPIESMSTMGCRTQNGADINAKDSYYKNIMSIIKNDKLYDNFRSAAQKDGRGNICPVTIIMPTLAMKAKEASENNKTNIVEEFMNILDKKIHEAKDQLIERYKYICSQSPSSASFMYDNNTMYGYVPEEGIKSAMRHGTLALGQLGLAETLQILIGKDHTTEEGMNFARRIEKLFNTRCAEFKNQYKLNFGVYYTPRNLWVA